VPVALYLVLDFTDPHLPGAVTFDVDECVEGVRVERPRAGVVRAPGAQTFTPERLAPARSARLARACLVHPPAVRLGVVPARDPRRVTADPGPPPADDH